MNNRTKILLVILGAVMLLIIAWLYFYRPYSEATSLEAQPDRISVFVYPSRIVADGQEAAKIIAVVKKNQAPMSNIKVQFKTDLGNLSFREKITDNDGQAVIYISSDTAGQANVIAQVGDMTKEGLVTFYNLR